MRHRIVLVMAVLLFGGCVGQGEQVKLYPRVGDPIESPSPPRLHDRLVVRIVPFDDRRSKTGPAPRRIHAAGGETQYTIWGGKPGEGIARFIAEYLGRRGWDVGVVGVTERPGQPADVVLTGQVDAFDAQVTSLLGSTRLNTAVRVSLQTRPEGAASGDASETERMTLEGARQEKHFLYDDRDLERAIETMLMESLDRLMAETTVVNRMWRAKFE